MEEATNCLLQTKGTAPCPDNKKHICKSLVGHEGIHECKCGYTWLSTEMADKRTGITDMTLGEPSESPFDPQADWLVLMMEGSRDMTASGKLYVPDTAKEAPQVGRVLAAGPGIFAMNDAGEAYCTTPMLLKVDERVMFAKYAGAEIEWTDGKTYLFVKQSEIICKVK